MADLEVGAGLSVGEQSVSLLAGIKASMDGMVTRLDKVLKAQEDYARFGPIRLSLRGSVEAPATGVAIIALGGPSYGRLWELRRLVVGGANWGSTVAGRADVIISPTQPPLTARSLPTIVDELTSLPGKAFYSSAQVVLRNPERLWIVVVNPTASTTYTAGGGAFDIPDQPTRAVVEA